MVIILGLGTCQACTVVECLCNFAAAGITDMFDSIQLIPASSGHDMHSAQKDKAHLPNIKKDSGVEYRDMLFFDDESPNIMKVSYPKMPQCSPQGPCFEDNVLMCQAAFSMTISCVSQP